jgi:hypothetical protein
MWLAIQVRLPPADWAQRDYVRNVALRSRLDRWMARATHLRSGFIGEASMSAALHQTSSFLRHWAHSYEARQAKAQQIVDQHRRFYWPETFDRR